jgi:hypothetical protein
MNPRSLYTSSAPFPNLSDFARHTNRNLDDVSRMMPPDPHLLDFDTIAPE